VLNRPPFIDQLLRLADHYTAWVERDQPPLLHEGNAWRIGIEARLRHCRIQIRKHFGQIAADMHREPYLGFIGHARPTNITTACPKMSDSNLGGGSRGTEPCRPIAYPPNARDFGTRVVNRGQSVLPRRSLAKFRIWSRLHGLLALTNALMNLPSTWVQWRRHQSLSRQKLACIFDAVDPGRLYTDVYEPGSCELLDILGFLHGAGNAAHPEFDIMPDFRRTSPRTTTSETAKRPPGFNTRNASLMTRFLSADKLITQLEMITSTTHPGAGCSRSRP